MTDVRFNFYMKIPCHLDLREKVCVLVEKLFLYVGKWFLTVPRPAMFQ